MTTADRTSLACWTEILCGIEVDRTLTAFACVDAWKLKRVSDAVAADTIDSAFAAVMLVEGIDDLVEAGVDHARLLKKLRTEDFWSTWAEIRVASILLGVTEEPMEVELEVGRSKGAHPDWQFRFGSDGDPISVEVKAVGLSDDEVEFCKRMAPSLDRLLPKVGLGHFHSSIRADPPRPTKEERRHAHREARRLLKGVPAFPTGLRGLAIVGHDTEDTYRKRIARKVTAAVRQLPATNECWVALYWCNGAPLSLTETSVDWSEIPEHVSGVLFAGHAVAFPHRNVHCFATRIDRDLDRGGDILVESIEGEEMSEIASLVLERFERSAGVRPTVLRVGDRDLLRRDGTQRLVPFNLLLDDDPEIPPGLDFRGRATKNA